MHGRLHCSRQFGREQTFVLENIGNEPVFSEYRVTNPASGGRYRVAIRGRALGENYCSCPDFATNDLGTCKHVEFTLARLEHRRGGVPRLPGDSSRRTARYTFATAREAQRCGAC